MISSSTIVNLALGAVAIAVLLPMRSQSGRLRYALGGLCIGVLAGLIAINTAASGLGAARDSNIRPVVKYALETADSAKLQVLFVGSSYSALGVDSSLIARELNAHGYDLQVLSLAKPGNYMISQDYTLDYYLARAKKVPEVVFIEIGPEYYNDAGAIGNSYRYTGTAIADHAPDQFAWRLRSIGVYEGTPAEKATDYWDLATHTLFHLFDFGLSGQLVSDKSVTSSPGFTPEETAHIPVKPSDIAELRQPAELLSDGPLPEKVRFIVAFRRMQIAKLKARGVKLVGFYQTEMAPVQMRDFGKQICHELHGVPCIIADDPNLQRSLSNPALWYDPVHMLHSGAELYSAWLGNRLALALHAFRKAGSN